MPDETKIEDLTPGETPPAPYWKDLPNPFGGGHSNGAIWIVSEADGKMPDVSHETSQPSPTPEIPATPTAPDVSHETSHPANLPEQVAQVQYAGAVNAT